MPIWELARDAMVEASTADREWLNIGEITRDVLAKEPDTNTGTIHCTVRYHCINDPSKKHSPGLQYRTNPLFITDSPTARGKRYRLLSSEERHSFLANVRDDLELVSYAQTLEWLADTTLALETSFDEEALETSPESEEIVGLALLELHLQDYIHRHWKSIFPSFKLYQGIDGREFRTSEPNVGTMDFLCIDEDGNFVVIETKRDLTDRKAVGQILGYMGWVDAKLCNSDQSVSGILIAGEPREQLGMAIRAVPNLRLYKYELSFSIAPVGSSEDVA